jgi:dUTPase
MYEGIYMRIEFGKLNKLAVIPEGQAVLPLVTPIPLELQAGERVDLKTGLSVRVPEGYILSIQSSPALLVHKGLEVLGLTYVAPEDEEELKIPLFNVGKSQLNLHPGMQVAVAILQIAEAIEIEEFSPEKPKALKRQPRTRGDKKDRFKFEVS